MSERFQGYRFEELEVWRLGMEVVHEAYTLAKKFPRSEMFALSDQLRRAATSIVLNIAEGSGQPTKKGFALYVERSKSSTLECVACARIAVQEQFATKQEVSKIEQLLEKEYFKLVGLAKSMRT
jgi:four helix bundle protein